MCQKLEINFGLLQFEGTKSYTQGLLPTINEEVDQPKEVKVKQSIALRSKKTLLTLIAKPLIQLDRLKHIVLLFEDLLLF